MRVMWKCRDRFLDIIVVDDVDGSLDANMDKIAFQNKYIFPLSDDEKRLMTSEGFHSYGIVTYRKENGAEGYCAVYSLGGVRIEHDGVEVQKKEVISIIPEI